MSGGVRDLNLAQGCARSYFPNSGSDLSPSGLSSKVGVDNRIGQFRAELRAASSEQRPQLFWSRLTKKNHKPGFPGMLRQDELDRMKYAL